MRRVGVLAVVFLLWGFLSPAGALECSRDCATVCTNIHDPNLMLPDLVSLAPSYVRNARQGTHRVVLFTSTPANIGDGPLIVHGKTIDGPDGPVTVGVQEIWKRDGTSCTHDAGVFEFHPSHHHFHIGDFAAYQLRKDDPINGPIVAESTKVSFCLLDIAVLRSFGTSPQVVSNCLDQEGTQGISVGYADVYDWYLPGQSIDLDADPENPVPGGNYYVVNIVNPDGLIWEKDDSLEANIGASSVRVPAPRVQRVVSVHQPHNPSTVSSVGSPHSPHSPHAPFLGPRPRLPHRPNPPHQPGAPAGPQH
jgi:hypothetical protein